MICLLLRWVEQGGNILGVGGMNINRFGEISHGRISRNGR